MANIEYDYKGLICPTPILRISAAITKHKKGDVIDVLADCPKFEVELRKWADRLKKQILFVRPEGEGVRGANKTIGDIKCRGIN